MPDYENNNVLANVDEKDPVYSGIFSPTVPFKTKRPNPVLRYIGFDEFESLGIEKNFTYTTPNGSVLKQPPKPNPFKKKNSTENYVAVLDELGDTILNYGKADTPEKQQELYNLTVDYMKYNQYFKLTKPMAYSTKINERSIKKSENPDILAKAYSDVYEKSKGISMRRAPRFVLSMVCMGSLLSMLIPGANLVAAGAVAFTSLLVSGLIPVVAKIKEVHAKNKAKRAIKKESKGKIKEIKDEIKNLKSKKKEELKNAATKEEKAEIKAKYEKLINESKQAIAKENDIIKEKIENMPKYSDCKYKEYLDYGLDVSKVMAYEATKAYNQKHGIEAATPAAKPKQAEQQVTREKVLAAEHKAERVTGVQQPKRDERIAGMRQ